MVMYLRPEVKVKQPKHKVESFTTTLIDDDEKEFEVEITYDYHESGWYFERSIMIPNFDYKVNGKANISEKELCNWVKDEIRDHEKNSSVTFY